MIKSNFENIKDIHDFYEKILRKQKEMHGFDYHLYHDSIKKYLKKDDVYMEFGVHQGTSAITAILCHPKKVILVDKSLDYYNEFLRPFAEKYCLENDIEIVYREMNSDSDKLKDTADVLLIDSVHRPLYLQKELIMHGHRVRKYIIAHDTMINGMSETLQSYASVNNWKVIEHCKENCGHMVIERCI